MTTPIAALDAFAGVVGQEAVVTELRAAARAPSHAYLLVGIPGAGTTALARAFAADLVGQVASEDRRERAVELALAVPNRHPDVVLVAPEGNTVREAEARVLLDEAVKSPVEGERKVLIGVGFEAMTDKAAGMLLKTIEEPAATSVLVLLAEDVPAELVTIASRCVRIDVPPLPDEVVRDALVIEGVTPERAGVAATAAAGDLDRARVLAGDDRLDLRRQAWEAVPATLDGSGATAHRLVEDLLGMVDDAMAPLVEAQAAERLAAEADQEAYGGRRSSLSDLDRAHKRQQRRFRTDELRFGLALLQRTYRDQVVGGERLEPGCSAVASIGELGTALARHNPNEKLQLLSLFLRLPSGR